MHLPAPAAAHPADPHHGAEYAGVFLAALASWAGLSGIGEATLIAAGIAAANRHLQLDVVVAIGWAGAIAGGVVGWIVGLKGGRGLLAAPGPLHDLRLRLIAAGDRLYERYGVAAVLVAPTWIAGIHHMRAARFLAANAATALVWAVAIAGGAYLVGPSIAGAIADERLLAGALVLAVVALGVGVIAWRGRGGQA